MIAPVNHIVDMSFIDGPGNRTVIFFQGCNFCCQYCHNPETIHICNHCGQCVSGCVHGALSQIEGKVFWNDELCVDCGACYKKCPYWASPRVHWMSVEEVMERIRKNRPFIRGITVSGGECSLHRDFLLALFRQAKSEDLGTLMDSNGGIPLAQDQELLELTDGIMLDIKAYDKDFHRRLTGRENRQVLQNAIDLVQMGKLIEIRTVVFKEEEESYRTIVECGNLLAPYLKNQRRDVQYRLIKFRPIGVRGEASSWETPSQSEMEYLREKVLEQGFSRVIIS